MTQAAETELTIPREDKLRADLYDFLSALLAGPPPRGLLEQAGRLSGDSSPLGQAIATLATLAGKTSERGAEREFTDLFIGIGRGELVPYASYYMTGFLNEKPLAALRVDMARHAIRRAPTVHEPEDNIASLMEMMAGLIDGRFGAPATLAQQRAFFNRHVSPWAGHFFSDLEGAKTSVLYAPVGTIGRLFREIEREAFRMAAE